jgi:hypothetical protein
MLMLFQILFSKLQQFLKKIIECRRQNSRGSRHTATSGKIAELSRGYGIAVNKSESKQNGDFPQSSARRRSGALSGVYSSVAAEWGLL